MVNKKGELTSHTKIIESSLGSRTLSREPQDMITPVLNLDTDFSVEIPTRAEFKENTQRDITCFIDCSKLDDNKTGAGIVIRTNNTTTITAKGTSTHCVYIKHNYILFFIVCMFNIISMHI